ncbi:hypothetical protein FSP39_021777 [Pinctada imbricata]|uniref:Zinc finger PHD-type domain-containing protein n=1 Tax=Pinctada imbricata TaxID=66713 RepID=A0AA89C469_PINIB|nr:hypothetical protein FSP39_021777 [Pinctada imbricata]
MNKCRVCGEGQLERREIWIGCSHPSCDYWLHAECMGISAKTKAFVSSIKWYCVKHRSMKH